MKNVSLILIIVFLKISLLSRADELFDNANKLYSENNYIEALSNYKKLEEKGIESASLYFNIGNCYYKLDSINMAILYFERAKKLKPNDADIQHNIDYINQSYTDKIEELPQIFFSRWNQALIKLFGKSTWTYFSIITYLILLISIVIFFTNDKTKIKKNSLIISIIALGLSIFTSVYAYQEYKYQTKDNSAIIFTPTLNVKSSPDESSANLFVIHQGTKVFIIDKIDKWLNIKIKDGNQGWVKEENLKII